MSYDAKLGLVYLPTGNGPPDYWGGDRNQVKEKFGTAIVAVDASTGKAKWVYQTVHHDVWDYDLPSQPVLYEMKNAQGTKTPVLIQTTKTGNIFVLDRRTGQPVTEVQELPVPTSPAAEGEHLAPTQPHSVGMPVIGAEPLTEKSMWGVSTFDQLYCRIMFKDSVYVGPFTPPSEKPYIEWPGLLGGMNWGGISIDENTGMMFVNDMRLGLWIQMIPSQNKGQAAGGGEALNTGMGAVPLKGTPYAVNKNRFLSVAGIPCQAPPFGTLTAIDMKTQKIAWQVPVGTVEDTGPLGIRMHLPIKIGLPTLGGTLSTQGGLIFIAGTQDFYLRAFNSGNGEEVWKARLPVGSQGGPMTYVSPKTGKQYVVITAGGARQSTDRGDYVMAYALP